MKKDVIVIVGPTASGKSGIGIALAKKANGIIISADSMQIYKKLDIGTAKVTPKEADDVKHELIDIVDIDTSFSVSDYKKMCYEKIEQILKEKKTPIIVGGTGLYINAVINNLDFLSVDKEKEKIIDEKIKKLSENMTSEQLYEYLKEIDIESAKNIDKNNTKRILRAIKLSLIGMPKSKIDKRNDLWNTKEELYNFHVYYINIPRDLLYERINKRVDEMVKQGILDEAKLLYNKSKTNKNITALQAIGYKEFFEYFEGQKTLEECVALLKQKTRNYAKRQITWFKKLDNKIEINGSQSKEKILDNILKEYYGE